MAGLIELIENIRDSGRLETMVRNPMAQFIDPNTKREFMGAKWFPRQNKPQNEYREAGIQLVIYPARDNSPYSPVIHENSFIKADADVKLGHIDAGSQLVGRQFTDLQDFFRLNGEMAGTQSFLNWLNSSTALALAIKGEQQCWELIQNGQVTVSIDNTDYVASYSAPAGNRFNATASWTAKTSGVSDFDPFVDISAGWDILWNAGFDIQAMVTSNKVAGVLARNTKVAERAGYLVSKSGVISSVSGMNPDSLGFVNQALQRSGEAGGREIPLIQTYDHNYNIADAGSNTTAQPSLASKRQYFLDRNCFVIIGKTNLQYPILAEDNIAKNMLHMMDNALGYTGVGIVPGYDKHGIIAKMKTTDEYDKTQGVMASAYMQSCPVASSRTMEAIVVIKNIALT